MLLTLTPGAATADYYQVDFSGEIDSASSRLLWTESIAGEASG